MRRIKREKYLAKTNGENKDMQNNVKWPTSKDQTLKT